MQRLPAHLLCPFLILLLGVVATSGAQVTKDEAQGTLGPATPNPGLKYYYPVPAADPPRTIKVDVCVYGGTPAGVAAAVQARRMSKTAVLAVFGRHVGGLTSAGLTAVDLGNADSIGGIASDFLHSFGRRPGAKPSPRDRLAEFRSSQAEQTFRAMLAQAGAPVLYEHRLKEVKKTGLHITSVSFENGNVIEAKEFIDATYEGDLLAMAGVSFHVGRESNDTFGETVDGFFIGKGHQFRFNVDPYRTPGKPESGLLPGISAEPPVSPGTGDKKIQSYNFRMWAVTASTGIPWPKPANYDADSYALLLRYLTTKPDFPWDWTYRYGPVKLNIGDCNNAGPFSTDFVGGNYAWPEADYATREKIFQAHVTYQQGLMWFLAHDERLPQRIRDKVKQFALPKDEFVETGGWPQELYVREARRMISDYVMSEKNCLGKEVAADSIGLASYTMDSHLVQRVVVNGSVSAEGNVESRVPQPYPVSYRSLVPKVKECDNLLVPVCVSSSHIAYGSIRMEPVFMILGQSAATAASLAIDAGVPVQSVKYDTLKARLLADNQKLTWAENPPKARAMPPYEGTGDLKIDRPEDKVDVKPRPAPDGAIVLFNGKDLSDWHSASGKDPAGWEIAGNHVLQVKPGMGNIITQHLFDGAYKLHVEFRIPYEPNNKGQGRGNSGVYVNSHWEVQVLDAYHNEANPIEACGAIESVEAARENVAKAPTVWQSYDMEFHPAKCEGGRVLERPTLTVLWNGIEVHHNTKLTKDVTPGGHGGDICKPGPLMLQDHGHPVQFRNIWAVPIE